MKKIKIMMLFIVLAILIAIPDKVHAGYQSKPGTVLGNKAVGTFFVGCRNMETSGGVLGLEEGLNADYTGTTVGGNGIDAHMALNTEWGTVALFTNSQYGIGKGISGTDNSSRSNGNATGIYGLANSTPEYVACVWEGKSFINGNLNERYLNTYSTSTPKAGDALECTNWLNSTANWWISGSKPFFERGYNGLFGFVCLSDGTRYRNSRYTCSCCLRSRTLINI